MNNQRTILGLVMAFFLLWVMPSVANNVRIVENPVIDEMSILNDVAVVKMKIAWDNSWRDDFNWDAVYIFVKYRKKDEALWKHVYLMDGGHSVSANFEFVNAKSSTTVNQTMGLFVQRNKKGAGDIELSLGLRWLITQNGLSTTDFMNQKIEIQATCIEMVYVPQGAYCLGDGASEGSFRTEYRPILPEWDVLKNDGTMTFKASGNALSDAYKNYPPENAVNRVNENRSSYPKNAWMATAAGESNWVVDFGANPKEIRYFGVSGAKGYENYRPESWELRARNENTDWVTLWTGKKEFWVVENNSYPVQRAIQVDPKLVKPYQYYQIHVITSSYPVVANNIAMTEVDMSKMTNDAYVMDRATGVQMDKMTKLSADDEDTWTGNLSDNYPTGFNGFYAMKYEISQEQWVRFLNKLEYNQQKARTIGTKLDQLVPGDYIYGDKDKANCRNGIAIGTRENGNVVFVNNLNKSENNPFAQADDGQNVACNYMSPADMLAYADWCGLRPLSEMEYEKMARAPYPAIPEQGEWAGGPRSALVLPIAGGISNPRTNEEKLIKNDGKNVNVNAGARLDGPVRVGCMAYASEATQEASGSGFWGGMDLSGNLSEIYYNCSYGLGRNFYDILEAHGDGNIYDNSSGVNAGNTNISATYWPQTAGSFMLRGGNFTSAEKRLAISDRSANGYYSSLNIKDSIATFRLGHSYTKIINQSNPETFLTLANNKMSTADASAIDSVCSGSLYTIRGTAVASVAQSSGGRYSYIWYKSENKGTTWDIIRGEEGQDLTYNNFYNDGGEPSEVWFRRKTITNLWWSETKYVIIRVVNTSFDFSQLKDTITIANHVIGFQVSTKTRAQFTWKWKSASGEVVLRGTKNSSFWDFYAPLRRSFKGKTGDQTLVCEVNFMNRCIKKQELPLHIVTRPTVGVPTANVAINASDPKNECGVVMQDSRASQKSLYATVRIGEQCWMAENLRYVVAGLSFFSDKDPSGEYLGAYYKYNTQIIENACPPGWKVPAIADFDQLVNYINVTYGGTIAGMEMKQGAFWYTDVSYKEHIGNNRSGFGALGAGYLDSGNRLQGYSGNDGFGGEFFNSAYFGTSDYYNAYYKYLVWNNSALNQSGAWWHAGCGWHGAGWYNGGYGFSIRCIKE